MRRRAGLGRGDPTRAPRPASGASLLMFQADSPFSHDAATSLTSPRKIVLGYLAVSLAWVFGSDAFVAWFIEDASPHHLLIDTSKGSLFVLATTLFLYVVLKRRQQTIIRLFDDVRAHAAQYYTMFTSCRVPMLVVDPTRDGRILDANEAAQRLYGWSLEELRDMSSPQLNTLPDDEVRERLKMAMRGERHEFECRHRRRDGTIFDVQVFRGPLRLEGRDFVLSVVVDVSAQREAEARLARSASLLQAIDAASPNAILAHRLDGRWMHWNQQLLNMWGIPPERADMLAESGPFDEEALDRLLAKVIDPAHFRANVQIAMSDSPVRIDDELRFLDGRVVSYHCEPIRVSSDVLGRAWYFSDLTDLIAAQSQLTQAVELLEILFDGSPLAIVALDLDRRVTLWNRAAEELFGWLREETIGNFPPYVAEEHREEFLANTEPILRGETLHGHRMIRMRRDGKPLVLAVTAAPVRGRGDEVDGLIGIFEDLSERERSDARLIEMATKDGLTGLLNRTSFREQIEMMIELSRAREEMFALYFIDLDNFKIVNDSLGHYLGDHTLRRVAEMLESHVRAHDVIARLGGDEFGILQGGLRDRTNVGRLAERLVNSFHGSFDIEGHVVPLSCSVGVAVFPDDGETPEELLRRADLAMYAAKQRGRHTWATFDDQLEAAVNDRMRMEVALGEALAHDRLELHFQPKVRLGSGEVASLEALIRWNDSELGWVSPARIIEVAETCGLIERVGTWVFRRACGAVRRLRDPASGVAARLSVGVNVSMAQFRDPRFVANLLRILAEEGVAAADFEVELTETMLAYDAQDASDRIKELTGAGFAIAIDDFGTGYSSLAYLAQYHVDRLKVDRTFVANVPGDRRACEVLTASVALASALGVAVIAEGVEREDQERFLMSIGVEEAQGFYYSKPLPLEEFLEWWRARGGEGTRAAEGDGSQASPDASPNGHDPGAAKSPRRRGRGEGAGQ